MADHNNAKDAVTAWLNESEGFSLRIERLHEDAASGNDLVPWLVEAFRLGADRAAPEGQVRALARAVGDDQNAGWTLPTDDLAAIKDQAYDGWGEVVSLEAVEAIALEVERRILTSLTPPPAAPTDNTALAEALPKGVTVQMVMDSLRGMTKSGGLTPFQQINARYAYLLIEAALASREAPPAAPKIEAIFETVDDSVPVTGQTQAPVKRIEHQDDGSFTVVIDHWPSAPPAVQESFCRSCGNTGGVADADDKGEVCWDSCPVCHPPACQQKAMPVGCGHPCGYDCNGACFDSPACQQKALVEALRELTKQGRKTWNLGAQLGPHWVHLGAAVSKAERLLGDLASREAPPAAQKPVAWRCKDYADDWIIYRNKSDADQYQDATGCLMQPLYPAPPPDCQQEAVTVAEAAEVLLNAQIYPSSVNWQSVWDAMREDAKEGDLPMAFNKALRALKGGE